MFMKFCWVTITVKNMGESLRFYQEIVGLTIAEGFKPDRRIFHWRYPEINLLFSPAYTVLENLR